MKCIQGSQLNNLKKIFCRVDGYVAVAAYNKDMNKILEIRILNADNEVIEQYYLPYEKATEVAALIAEAREAWCDNKVEVETDTFIQTFCRTYSQEIYFQQLGI